MMASLLCLTITMSYVSTNIIKPCQNEEDILITCIVGGNVKQADCEHVTVKTLRLF